MPAAVHMSRRTSYPSLWTKLAVVLLALSHEWSAASAFARHPAAARRAPPLRASGPDDTSDLLDRARKLRREAAAMEASKRDGERQQEAEAEARRAAEREAQAQTDRRRGRYQCEVPILKDMGEEVMERVDFPPRLKGGTSRIVAVQAPLPLGLILGQDASAPGLTSVDDVAAGGNGDAANIRRGDVVRAVTACQTTMETPTWQLIAGGIGQPKTKRFVYSVDGRPLEEVLEAVGSNRMDVQGRDVWLVLERLD